MKQLISTTLALILMIVMVAGCAERPTEIPSGTSVATATPTITPKTTPTAKPTMEPTPEATATVEPTPTVAPTPQPHEHKYNGDTVKATCTEGGYTKYTCSCGSTYTDSEVEKLGHNFTTEVVKATYDAGGYTIYTCSVCGLTYEDNQTAALPRPTEAPVSDNVAEPTPTPAPTEPPIEESNKEVVVCPYCGGSHYLYECPVAAEERAEATPEPISCFYCGSITCPYPSTGDKTLCLEYDELNDPTMYCQTCGESTSVCERWLVDKDCPRCGEAVPARTCHHCPNK